MCPLCRQHSTIPTEGINGFITNFLINTLKDREELAAKLQSKDARFVCSYCNAIDTHAEAFCTDCCGFICQECGMRHKKVVIMQNHKTVNFADLQSGKVDIKSVMRQEYCRKHKGQILEFFCKTCDVLVCVGCTDVDHLGHTRIKLKSSTDDQKSEIKQLSTECGKISQVVAKALKCVDKVRNELQKGVEKAKADLHLAAEEFRKKVLAQIQQKEIDIEGQITQAATENINQIDAQKDILQLQQIRLQTPLQMASEVTQSGSDNDFALIFSSLKSCLNQLRDMKVDDVDENLGEIEFTRNQYVLSPMLSLGYLSVGSKKNEYNHGKTKSTATPATQKSDSSATATGVDRHIQEVLAGVRGTTNDGTWKLIKQFGFGKLSCGRDIAITSDRYFIVTDLDISSVLQVFNQSGTFKCKLDIGQGLKSRQKSYPWNVVVSTYGRIFTTQQTSHVNVCDTTGTFKYQFATRSPSNVSCTAQNAELIGLAIDNQGCVFVGEYTQQYISKHLLDGSHISSIKVPISPCYIAVPSQDHIIVSSGWGGTAHILDTNGNIIHTLNPPPSVNTWNPCGICYTSDDEIYLANCAYGGGCGGIYRYSKSGQYLGCIIKHVEYPAGLTLTDDDNTLVVVEEKSVKVFSRN
ncbi:uncharacterized protein [Amphiura filiformis]|uniref:uncharacterized protein n=1 Tax=Amphiura filiformis TaxID=82378 RepID=UPI003B225C62